MKFNERLRDKRKELGFTQKQVAEKLKISVTGYGGYEQGYREPDYETLVAICKLFDVSSDYLLGLDED